MMDGPAGQALTQETIDEAVACRLAVARVRQEFLAKKDWFFAPWNADEVRDPKSGRRIPFHEAPAELLATDPSCWVLHPGESWHGFEDLPDGWCMLDPIKFGIVCPGMKDDGQLDDAGIPADIVTAYLGRHGIVPSRTTDHMVLFLFSMGVTKGKWGTLLNTLLDFKADYDRNAPLAEVLPAHRRGRAAALRRQGLKDLGDEMWAHLRKSRQGHWQAQAYATLPEPEMTPRRAFQRLMAGDAEKVPLDEMADRVVAVGVIPYPPGIPIVMPGESIGPADGPWLTYLRTLQEYGHRFPGFAKEVEGAEEHDGVYHVYCVKEAAAQRRGRTIMIEYAAKTPTIPIPFHKLLKVVALVDGDESRKSARCSIGSRRRTSRSRSAIATTATSPRTRTSARTSHRSTASGASRRASWRKPCATPASRTPLWALADSQPDRRRVRARNGRRSRRLHLPRPADAGVLRQAGHRERRRRTA